MQKLTYIEYKGNENILEIDLHNGYTIIAIKTWNKEKRNYLVELFLKNNTVDKWDLVEDIPLEFNTNYKFINSTILKQVAIYYKEKVLLKYINRYEYEIKCFELGDEILTREDNNVS